MNAISCMSGAAQRILEEQEAAKVGLVAVEIMLM